MSESSWKDHPIIIAAIAVAATTTFCYQFVIPTYTTSLNNSIESLKKNQIELSSKSLDLNKKIEALTKKLEISEKTNKDLLSQLEIAQEKNLFSNTDSYPIGLGSIKIGDPMSLIFNTYPKDSINLSQIGYITVKNQHRIFSTITYYSNHDEKKPKISHIMFSIDYKTKLNDDFLQKKIIDSFGMPETWEWDKYYSWPTKDNLIIYKDGNLSFQLMDSNHSPIVWPQKKSCQQLTKN